jgi:hypothetical protein
MSHMQPDSVDPELERQLRTAGRGDEVQCTITLRPPEGAERMEESEVRKAVDQIIQKAQAASGEKVSDVNVLPRLHSFVLAAPAKVVRAILDVGGIASAMANRQQEDLAIEPVPRSPRKDRRRGGGNSPKGED